MNVSPARSDNFDMGVSNYELMVIGAAAEADSLFTKIEKAIKDANASSVSSQKLGKKPLAYTIKKQTEAEYFLFNFEAEGDAPFTILSKLKLEQEAVLRYLILRTKESKRSKGKGESKIEKPSSAKASEGKKVAKVEVKADTKNERVSRVARASRIPRASKGDKVKGKAN